jgi:hypothetical protein
MIEQPQHSQCETVGGRGCGVGMNREVMFSSKSGEYGTPVEFYKLLDDEFNFTLDPAATEENAKCGRFFIAPPSAIRRVGGRRLRVLVTSRRRNIDGLVKSWGKESVFINPPYGDPESPCKDPCPKKKCRDREYHLDFPLPGVGDWVRKAYTSSLDGATCVILLPARIDTRWFHEFAFLANEIRVYQGRLRFVLGDLCEAAPFPSMVLVFRPPGAARDCAYCTEGLPIFRPFTMVSEAENETS